MSESSSLLQTVCDWTRRNIGEFDLLVGDYLNRHNYQAFSGVEEAAAIDQTMNDGATATKRLQNLIARCSFENVSIISAAQLCAEPSFSVRLANFERHYCSHRRFRAFIDDAVDSFLARKYPTVLPDEKVRGHCIAYQLEELAIFEILAEQGYNTFIYPGAQLPVMKDIVSGSLDGVSRALGALTLIELRLFEDSSS